MGRNELTNAIRDYVDSEEFEYKFKTWTSKTCKEVMAGYWKPIATISSVFITVISVMFSFIFGHFNQTIENIQASTQELTSTVIRLEQTIDIIFNPNMKDHIIQRQPRNENHGNYRK